MKIFNPLLTPSQTVGTTDEQARGSWNVLLQQFILTPTGEAVLEKEEAYNGWSAALDKAIIKLNDKPSVETQLGNGLTKVQPPRRITCPTCKSENIEVPLVAVADEAGVVVGARPGKGDCSCPECGYTGKKAVILGYTMYTYADLVRARFDLLTSLKAKRAEISFNDELA